MTIDDNPAKARLADALAAQKVITKLNGERAEMLAILNTIAEQGGMYGGSWAASLARTQVCPAASMPDAPRTSWPYDSPNCVPPKMYD